MRRLTTSPAISFSAAAAVWQRNFAVYRRTFHMNILPNFFEPVLYLVAMGFGLGRYVDLEGVPYLVYLAPGLMALQAMNGATFETTYNVFIRMHFSRIYDAVLATPVAVEEIVLGEAMWALTRSTSYGLVFFAVLSLFGLVATPWALACMLAVPVIGTMFAACGLFFTSINPTIDLYTYYFTLFISPMVLFSGVFYPVAVLPGWAQAAAWATPLYHGVELMRGLFTGNVSAQLLVHLLYMAAASSLLFFLAARRFRARLVM